MSRRGKVRRALGAAVTGWALALALAAPATAGAVGPAPRVEPPTAVAAPVVSIQLRSGQRQIVGRCGSQTVPCVVTERAGLAAVARTATPAVPGAIVLIDRRHRRPGTRAYGPRPALRARLDTAGAQIVRIGTAVGMPEAGSWCFRARVPGVGARPGIVSDWRCIRWRPDITVGWAGDTTLGSAAYGQAPGDGRSLFGAVSRELHAPDLMVGNYEGTISTGGHPRCNGGALCFVFQAAPRMARGIAAAGFDVMNLANNHGLDMGADARAQTVRNLTAAGVGVTGLPGQITVRQVADTRVALVGFGFNPGMMDLDDMGLVRSVIRQASRRADVVVAVMHSGTEGSGSQHVPAGDEDNRGRTRLFAATAIDAGADVVFGSGPHVLRGVEQRRGRLAFYSTGNFAGWRNFARGGVSSNSAIAGITVSHRGTLTAAHLTGLRIVGPGQPVLDRSGAVARLVAALSRADFGSRAPHIASSGRITLH